MKHGPMLVALALGAQQLVGGPSGVLTLVEPAENVRGWHNSAVTIHYFCPPHMHCPPAASLVTEGEGQTVQRTATHDGGAETPIVMSVSLDATAPRVAIETPHGPLVTRASSIEVNARAVDGLSGVTAATCNGNPAAIDAAGAIRCAVPLTPGDNDITVEASDAADNSGSAAIRVTRVGVAAHLHIFPEATAVLIGRPQTLQVFDDFWQRVPDVFWRVDDPNILQIEGTQEYVVSAKSAGRTTVTAIAGSLAVSAVVTTVQANWFPLDTVRWRVSGVQLTQMGPPQSSPSPPGPEPELISLTKPPLPRMLWAIGQQTGNIHWTDAPAMNVAERVAAFQAHVLGGAVAVVEGPNRSMALVRSGPSTRGAAPWRYRSAGRLSATFAQDADGMIVITEWDGGGFPRELVLDGRTGRIVSHVSLSTGVHVRLNSNCVAGANDLETVPATVGPPVVTPQGSLALEMVHHDDLTDEGQCGAVSGHVRRVVSAVAIRPHDSSVETLARYEMPAGATPPTVRLFAMASDEAGGMFAPWTVRFGSEGPVQPHLVHLTPNGAQEVTVPAVGEIVRVGGGKGAMTDGATVVAFKLSTGVVEWVRTYTKGPVRIIPAPPGTLLLSFPSGSQELDQFGLPVRKP